MKHYRVKQVLAEFAPVNRTTWWRWVKQGIAPKPVILGPKTIAWREDDLIKWQEERKSKGQPTLA